MRLSIKKGISFGLTSGIITTLGLIVGLTSGTHQRGVVIGGILIIAIADSLSDAFGIHISEEAENQHSHKEIWASTFATLVTKFIFAISFIIPVVFLTLNTAAIASVIWGILIITLVSCLLAKQQNKSAFKVIAEHITITIVVIFLTYYIGEFISSIFN